MCAINVGYSSVTTLLVRAAAMNESFVQNKFLRRKSVNSKSLNLSLDFTNSYKNWYFKLVSTVTLHPTQICPFWF
jgi:hypothetical protein